MLLTWIRSRRKDKGTPEGTRFGEEILTIKQMNFADIDRLVLEAGLFDFVLADLGVSSMQIDNPERGFTYKADGPLDLRLNPEKGISAAERLKQMDMEEIAGMFAENSDEPYAEEIAREIAKRNRKRQYIETTTELKEVIEQVLSFIPEKEREGSREKNPARDVSRR